MKEKKPKGKNVATVDTSELLKALKATHDEATAKAIADFDAETLAETSSEREDKAFESGPEFKETEEIFVETSTPINYVEVPEPQNSADSTAHNKTHNETHNEVPNSPLQEELFTDSKPEQAFDAAAEVLPAELADAQAKSIIESILFASSHPVTIAVLKGLFEGTNIDSEKLNHLIISLQTDYAGGERGIELTEVAGGYQLRTKLENAPWLKRMVKGRSFRLSGPALEVLSIVAYKQPVIKSEVDQIRGVESSHLLRALMEKNLIRFAGKSELPGKPMLYATTKEFLELFGLRNIRELPTLSEIDELIPEGIGEILEIEDSETLGTLSDKMGLPQGKSYSDSENELLGITEDLAGISTSSEFFEQEKRRSRERLEQERAQDLRERRIVGENLSESDSRWLSRYEAKIEALVNEAAVAKAQADARDIAEVIAQDSEQEAGIKNDFDA